MLSTNEKEVSKHNGKASISKDFQDIGKMTGTLATDAVHMIQENAAHLQENASQYYDQGIKQAKKFEKSLESRIQKNPVQSLLIVAGVGLVLGALWNRR